MQSRPEDSEAQEQCEMVAVPNLVAAKGCFAHSSMGWIPPCENVR